MYRDKINFIFNKMIEHEKAVPSRVQHFIKVHGFAKRIAEDEGLDEHKQFIIETAALMHDIGIRPSIVKYNSSAGHYQEKEGPVYARVLLEEAEYDEDDTDRICYLIAHHHSYIDIDGIDYQILVEADFLVNIFEENVSDDAVKNVRENIFSTRQGIMLLDMMYMSGEWRKN